MIQTIKLYFAQFKFWILAILWAVTVSGAAWGSWQIATGIEAKKQAEVMERAIKKASKDADQSRQDLQTANQAIRLAENKITYLKGIKRNEKSKCPADAALVGVIGLQRSLNKEIASMRVQ